MSAPIAKPYGHIYRQTFDATTVEKTLKIKNSLQDMRIWLRFEDDGLRTRLELISP